MFVYYFYVTGCVIAATHEQNRIIVYGGYSKERVKRDVDRGQVHTDMFALSHDSERVLILHKLCVAVFLVTLT